MRIGLGIASVALVVLSACGGSDTGSPAPSESPTPDLLTTGQACAQVQMVNDETDGPGNWPIPGYGEFGEKIAPLADESVPEIANALEAMSDQALKIGEMTLDDDVENAAGVWASHYEAVADICARTDSPIARIDY